MVKYLICPGMVRSQHDGDMHYISAKRLVRLYGVDPQEYVLPYSGMRPGNLIVLAPREDGNYSIEKEVEAISDVPAQSATRPFRVTIVEDGF